MELPKPRSLKPEFATFNPFLCLGRAPHPGSVLLGEQDLGIFFLILLYSCSFQITFAYE